MRGRLLLLILILIPCIACDQATKALAVGHLKGAGTMNVVDGVFRLVYAENPGAFLGLGRALPDHVRAALFSVGVALLLAIVAFMLVRERLMSTMSAFGLALLLAGGIGNLVDRFTRPGGRVVDFMQIGVGPVRTGIFNVADVQIMMGAALVAFGGLRKKRRDFKEA